MRLKAISLVIAISALLAASLFAGQCLAKEPVLELADNATAATQPKVVLPPEVEALFPKGECACGLIGWKPVDYSKYKKIQKFNIVMGADKAVCQDHILNLQLYGGVYPNGLQVAPPHPDHPHKTLFSVVKGWKWVNPIQHINVIRDYYDSMQQRRINGDNRPDAWKMYGPCVRQSLLSNWLIMEKGYLDIVGDGTKVEIYRFAMSPQSIRIRLDGTSGHLWRYHVYKSSPIKEVVNSRLAGNGFEPYVYDDTIYWVRSTSIKTFDKNMYSLNYTTLFSICHINPIR